VRARLALINPAGSVSPKPSDLPSWSSRRVRDLCRLHRAARTDQAADAVEWQLRPHGDDPDRQARREAEQAQGPVSGGVVAVGADREFDESGVSHRGVGGAVPLDDRGHRDREAFHQ